MYSYWSPLSLEGTPVEVVVYLEAIPCESVYKYLKDIY